jgi:hypothetical protein
MSEHYFGVGEGLLGRQEIARREKIAARHGARFYTMAGDKGHCLCGKGHSLGTCPVKRYWFGAPGKGEPFNTRTANAVLAELAS